MNGYRADTIVACATPAGRGAIAIVRCSGPEALAVARRIFRIRAGGEFAPWRMCLGHVIAADGTTPIDQGLGVYFPAPNSFTGEDTFEIHSHGSPVLVEEIVTAAIAAGARSAERGEFTRRAVLNGKLDLLQAEAIADLIDARMVAGARAAWNQLQGSLSDELAALRSTLIGVLADLEARIDFTDDELPEDDFAARASVIGDVARQVRELLDGFASSRRQREGFRVVFTGRPNAGKSSLVNRLLGSARMIVSAEPGTTRDAVDEAVDLGGVAFVFTDTAGIRGETGPAESEAVARARERVREADLKVLVFDGSLPPGHGDDELWRETGGSDTIVVINKSDLRSGSMAEWATVMAGEGSTVVSTSARTGDGCDRLAAELVAAGKRKLGSGAAGISRARHRAALERALGPLQCAQRLALSEDACELAVIEIRSALEELASIGQALGNEEILDRIFAEFCIGK